MFPTPLCGRFEAGGWRSQQTHGPLDLDSGVDHGWYTLSVGRKFRGGIELDYVGFWTDYGRFQLGFSEKRAKWVVRVISELEAADYLISGRAFTELLGRLGFAAQAVPWVRPLLGALYVWDSVVGPQMTARVPMMVALTLRVIKMRFLAGEYTASCWSPEPVSEEAFRTDAKCETGRVVVAGWECGGEISTARWFSFEVLANDAPWLYYRGVDVQKMSTAAEMLASLCSLSTPLATLRRRPIRRNLAE